MEIRAEGTYGPPRIGIDARGVLCFCLLLLSGHAGSSVMLCHMLVMGFS
jgi:hypothetical protein